MSELFYAFGIGFTLVAVVLSYLGLRSERFPSSRGVYAGGLAVMGLLVVASCAWAVMLAREEQEHHREVYAEFRAEQEQLASEETAAEDATGSDGDATPPELEEPVGTESDEGVTLDLTSPEDGGLVFEPETLEGESGVLTIEYINPSPVPHNVAIEEGAETLAQGATVTAGESGSATAQLEPGEYVLYCSIPGHRESGMEGTLTVE